MFSKLLFYPQSAVVSVCVQIFQDFLYSEALIVWVRGQLHQVTTLLGKVQLN